jgi:hypothetical protein
LPSGQFPALGAQRRPFRQGNIITGSCHDQIPVGESDDPIDVFSQTHILRVAVQNNLVRTAVIRRSIAHDFESTIGRTIIRQNNLQR